MKTDSEAPTFVCEYTLCRDETRGLIFFCSWY